MKRQKKILKLLVVCFLVIISTSCRTKKPVSDTLTPSEIPFAMGERFDLGKRITDVTFACVYFDFDSYAIKPSEIPKIEQVAGYMKSKGGVKLVVEGHCDERGSNEYNFSLGERRAQAVRAYLINLGVSAERIQTVSYGEERPVDSGHNEEAWSRNRRAEFALYE